jgi:hypothetical protein
MTLATAQSVKLLKGSLAATASSLVLFFPTAATPLSSIETEYAREGLSSLPSGSCRFLNVSKTLNDEEPGVIFKNGCPDSECDD